MTGLHTGHCRVRGNGEGHVPDEDLTLPKLLKTAGYHTACIGKYGLGKPLPLDDPQHKGFDEFFGYAGTSHAHNFYTKALIQNRKTVDLPNTLIPGTAKDAHDYSGSDLVGTGVAPLDGPTAAKPTQRSATRRAHQQRLSALRDVPHGPASALETAP